MEVQHLTSTVWEMVAERKVSQAPNVGAEVLTWENNSTPFTCVFMSLDGSAHFMCALEADGALPTIRPLQGLVIQVLRDYVVVGRPRQTYLDLRCTAKMFLPPFTRVIQDIATLILRDHIAPSDALVQVAEAWRAFWSPGERAPLSEQAQRGLIGELLIFEQLLDAGIAAADAWRGPEGDRHDFRTSVAALEVKTCIGLPRRHTINGVDQLSPVADLPLFLVSVQLDRAQGGAIDLLSTVRRITAKLSGTALTLFENKLGSVGYTPAHNAEYERNQYVAGEIRAYRVAETFPRIVRESFADAIPLAVERVSYVINVESEPFISLGEFLEELASGA